MTIIDISDPTGPEAIDTSHDDGVTELPSLKGGDKPAKAKKRMAREPGTLSVLAAIGKGDLDAAKPAKAPRAPKAPKEPKAPRSSKAAEVIALLEAPEGITRKDLEALTGWLPHTLRAFLSGLRKKGLNVTREPLADGDALFRIEQPQA